MLAAGMPDFPGGLPRVNSPRIIRYGPKNKAWYRLHEFIGRDGKSYIAGAYGMWGAIDAAKIVSDWSGFDQADRERIEREQAALERRERDKRERLAKAAALRGRQQYRHAQDLGPCPYLDAKGVKLTRPLKVMADGTLVVPMWRWDAEGVRVVLGVQKIMPDGSKRFNRGADQRAACCVFGSLRDGQPIYLAEGVATGLTIREALEGKPALVCAFNAGNLLPVASMLRQRFPASPIVLAADDDWRTVCDRHQREGLTEPMRYEDPARPSWCHCLPGRFYAERVAAAVEGVRVVLPDFGKAARSAKDTDFNDLHRLSGLEAVRRQLVEEGSPKKEKAIEKKKAPPPTDASLLSSWTYIRSSDMLFDASIHRLVKISHAKLDRGEALVKWWLGHPERRSVWAHDVVFEPGGCLPHQLNLFRGFERSPDASRSCALLLELLQTLCGEAGQDQAPITDWVLRWLAYPLQRPGAKMQSALVFHGDEGTGKNLFFGTVRAIYGSYGGIVTQSELESDFNGWASQKLFLVANEVVSRMELRHQTGRLKNLVTEGEININEKMLPLRVESNHIQFVFLSNEVQPLILGPNDRRYAVIHTPPPREKSFYASVREEIDAGGVEGLYAYLMALDLDGFSEHAEVPTTEAKTVLQELGQNSAQTFAAAWRSESLDWPYLPALTQDVYRAYQRWCARSGERLPMSMTRFSAEVAHFLKIPKRVQWIAPAGGKRRQATVFLVRPPPQGVAVEAWLTAEVFKFSDALRNAEREAAREAAVNG